MTDHSAPVPRFTIRNALQWDIPDVSNLLAAVLASTPVGLWLEPRPEWRQSRLGRFYEAQTTVANVHGSTRVAVTAAGDVIGAALWLPCAEPDPLSDTSLSGIAETADASEFGRRVGQLLDAAWQPHVAEPHQRLIGLGVRADYRRHGVATALLTDRQNGQVRPVRCVAVDESLAALCSRCGYRDFCKPAQLRPGGVIVRSLAFVPDVPAVRSRNAGGAFGSGRERPARGVFVVRQRSGGGS